MAIKVLGTTVIGDDRKADLNVVNPGRFTTAERDALSPNIGDIIYNTDEETPEVWNGSEWGPMGGSGGFKEVKPKPVNFQVDFLGSGTQADPWIVTPQLANRGATFLSDEIVVYGLSEFAVIAFEDENNATNANRFQQDPVQTNTQGYARFQLKFTDKPTSDPNEVYSGLLKTGTAYFKWDVTINDLGVEEPHISSIMTVPGGASYQPMTAPDYVPYVTSVGNLVDGAGNSTADDGSILSASPIANPTGDGHLPPSGTGLVVPLTVTNGVLSAVVPNGADAGTGYAHNETIYFDLTSLNGEAEYPITVKLDPVCAKNAVITTSPFNMTNAGSHSKTIVEVATQEDMTGAKTYEFTGAELTSMSVDLSLVPVPKYTDFYLRAKYVGTTTDSETGQPVESNWGPKSLASNGLVYSWGWSINNLSMHTNDGRNYNTTSNFQIAPEPYTYILFGAGGPGGGGYRANEGLPGTPSPFIQMVQVKQPIAVRVDSVDLNGSIMTWTQIEFGRGTQSSVNDYRDGYGGSILEETTTSGSGVSLSLAQDAEGFTYPNTFGGGSNYEPGDVIRIFPQPAICRGSTTTLPMEMVVTDIATQPPPADAYDPYDTQGGFTYPNQLDTKEDPVNDYLLMGYGANGGRDTDDGGGMGYTRYDYTSGDAPATESGTNGRERGDLPLQYEYGQGGCGRTSGGGGGFGRGWGSSCNRWTGGGANFVLPEIASISETNNDPTPAYEFYFYYDGIENPTKYIAARGGRIYAIRIA